MCRFLGALPPNHVAPTLSRPSWGGHDAWLKTSRDGSDRVTRADQQRTDTGQPIVSPLSSLAEEHGARRWDQHRARAQKEFQLNPPKPTTAAADLRGKGEREKTRETTVFFPPTAFVPEDDCPSPHKEVAGPDDSCAKLSRAALSRAPPPKKWHSTIAAKGACDGCQKCKGPYLHLHAPNICTTVPRFSYLDPNPYTFAWIYLLGSRPH